MYVRKLLLARIVKSFVSAFEIYSYEICCN